MTRRASLLPAMAFERDWLHLIRLVSMRFPRRREYDIWALNASNTNHPAQIHRMDPIIYKLSGRWMTNSLEVKLILNNNDELMLQWC